MASTSSTTEIIHYIPLGNSLTIGHGAGKGQSWPDRLTNHLQKEGVPVSLIRNLAYSGNTSRQVLLDQVPVFEKMAPDLSTLLIGSNDMARGVDLPLFTQQFQEIVDRMQKALTDPDQLLLLNLPDFASTPAALKYQGHLHMAPIIGEFNQVIEEEAKKRNLPLVNLYQITKKIGPDKTMYSWDGLHPSGRGYEELEKYIRPYALELIRKNKVFKENNP